MPLTKFKLVHIEGLKGLNFNGDVIQFADIDDALAEKLIGKTHVLERLPANEPAVLALAEATDDKKKDE